MNGYETNRAAQAELVYQRSIGAKNALLIDKQRRDTIDIQLGHVPGCSLTKCAEGCK